MIGMVNAAFADSGRDNQVDQCLYQVHHPKDTIFPVSLSVKPENVRSGR